MVAKASFKKIPIDFATCLLILFIVAVTAFDTSMSSDKNESAIANNEMNQNRGKWSKRLSFMSQHIHKHFANACCNIKVRVYLFGRP